MTDETLNLTADAPAPKKRKGRRKKTEENTVVAEVTETFINPISGQEETKIGGQFVIDGIQNKIDLNDGNAPRFNDGDTIDYIARDSSGREARGTYSLNGLLNQMSIIVGDPSRVRFDRAKQNIEVTGRFNVKESMNIHQSPDNLIRVTQNVMRLKGNGELERRASGLYGGY